jgi:hypothetical protein
MMHANDDQLLDLANRLLSEDRRSETLAHLRGCPPCAARLRDVAATREVARARVTAALAPALAPRTVPPSARRVAPLPLRPFALAATVLVVGVAAYLLWSIAPVPPGSRGEVTWLPSPDASIRTRGADSIVPDAAINEGLAAYRAHDAARTVARLSGAHAEGPMEQVRLLYLGNALLHLGRDQDALNTFRLVDFGRVPEPWRGEAQWSLSLALSGAGESRSADSLWKVLTGRPDAVGQRARRMRVSHAVRP